VHAKRRALEGVEKRSLTEEQLAERTVIDQADISRIVEDRLCPD
jgi:transcription initiation factor IIE alpha subunit